MPDPTPNTRSDDDVSLSRRQLLVGGSALLAAAAAGVASAANHDHNAAHVHGGPKKYEALTTVALDCLKTGQACLDHCMEMFKQKDTSLAECAARVQETLATCTMLSQLASFESKHLKSFLAGCIDVCNDCEKECRKHEKVHAECKACGDSCADCVREVKKVLSKA